MKKLNTDVQIKYNKKGNIKDIKTPYDNDATHQPFNVGEHNVAMLNSEYLKTFTNGTETINKLV